MTPTVSDLLNQTHVVSGWHRWHCDGGSVLVDRATLRRALEDAHDPSMPNWPAMVELADA